MTALVTDRRRRSALYEDGQESLFGGERLAAPLPGTPWERGQKSDVASGSAVAPRSVAAAVETPVFVEAPEREPEPEPEPEPATVVHDDSLALRTSRAPLTGPTLDDVVSRAWEGVVTGLPAACPLCHGELVPALGGAPSARCTSCGTSIE